MRKIKEILRMKHVCSLSKREIAQSCNVPRSTVGDYLRRARAAGLDWSEALKLTDTELESRLFPTEHLPSSVHRPPPDCAYIHDELQTHRKVNLTLTQMSAFVGVRPTQLTRLLWSHPGEREAGKDGGDFLTRSRNIGL